MREPKSFLKVLMEPGTLAVLAVALAMLIGIVAPASAQFFNFGGPPPRPAPSRGGGGFGWFGNDFFAPFQPEPAPRRVYQDFSKAPPPAKRDSTAERNVLVLGDAMADWLAYGLEEAYAEQPDMGVIRKHRTVSGLLKYQPKGEPSDWAAAARGILATEKPDAIVVMLGLHDRTSIRETVQDKDKKGDKDKKDARKPAETKPGETKPPEAGAKPDDKADAEQDDAENADTPPVMAPEKEKTARSGGLYEFRDERWVELYARKIEELIGVLKGKGVPVLWVGLPAIRGQKGTSDMLFLDSLYRDGAGKAGITYVDVWDGFVDEAGRFLQKGPDFEGQIRQLRSYDGTYFTKPGARKLAHYVEREISRLLAARSGPIALPSEPATPDASAVPGQPAPRPLAGPILPLVASSVGTDQLLGGPGSRPANVDALAARTLVKGEPLSPPAGRADDFMWPRREVGREPAKADAPVASTSPGGGTEGGAVAVAPAAPPKPRRPVAPVQAAPAPGLAPFQSPTPAPGPRNVAPAAPAAGNGGGFFGLGGFGAAPPPPPPAPRVAPRPAPANPGVPRPPASVGRSAANQAGGAVDATR